MAGGNSYAPGPDWDQRAAGWRAATMDQRPGSSGPSRALIAAARIRPGQKVLDLASGTGEPALAIARLVQPTGMVTALDLSKAMLDTARERAEKLGITNMDFRVGPMDVLDFEDHTFDVVTCRFGLMFADDAGAAMKEARRVLVPGGRIAVIVHGPRHHNTQFDVVRRALGRLHHADRYRFT